MQVVVWDIEGKRWEGEIVDGLLTVHTELGWTAFNGEYALVNHKWKGWYKDGDLHRINGPAVEYIDGQKEWWIEGKHLSLPPST